MTNSNNYCLTKNLDSLCKIKSFLLGDIKKERVNTLMTYKPFRLKNSYSSFDMPEIPQIKSTVMCVPCKCFGTEELHAKEASVDRKLHRRQLELHS